VSQTKPSGEKGGVRSGKFTDVAGSLLPLFPEASNRDIPRWRVLFGLDPSAAGASRNAADKRRPPSRKR
jgi:hypothetical protein